MGSMFGVEEQIDGFSEQQGVARDAGSERIARILEERMEAPPGFEPGMEVFQTVQGWLS